MRETNYRAPVLRASNCAYCSKCATRDFGTKEDCNCEAIVNHTCFGLCGQGPNDADCSWCKIYDECFDYTAKCYEEEY